jgi:peptide deformylase
MKETALKIRLFGDPVLRKKSKAVIQVTDAQRNILSEMARLMYAASGIGLAAPQVGINERMIVADIGSGLYKLINPKIVNKVGHQAIEEGCLSIPGICIKVKRSRKVLLEAQDEYGQPITIEAQDLLACVFQHEIEHLRGRMIIDYASLFDKLKIKKRLEELRKKTKHESLSESKAKYCKLQL